MEASSATSCTDSSSDAWLGGRFVIAVVCVLLVSLRKVNADDKFPMIALRRLFSVQQSTVAGNGDARLSSM
jgi:hypothetical protein